MKKAKVTTIATTPLNALNLIARNVTKPKKPAPWSYKGATHFLNMNREGVTKLRQRGFSWSQIVNVMQSNNIPMNYSNLYAWQLKAYNRK